MNRFLRGVSLGLLALFVCAGLSGLCSCSQAADSAMDCCEPGELSIAGMCCDRPPAVSSTPAPASILAAAASPSLSTMMAGPPLSPGIGPVRAVLARPIVARAILRI